jgi:hypothetical protein
VRELVFFVLFAVLFAATAPLALARRRHFPLNARIPLIVGCTSLACLVAIFTMAGIARGWFGGRRWATLLQAMMLFSLFSGFHVRGAAPRIAVVTPHLQWSATCFG